MATFILPYENPQPGQKYRTWKVEHKYADKQYAYTTIQVSISGLVKVDTKFSNGQRFGGDHFAVQVFFLGPNKEVVGAVRQVKGLNASFGGPAKEGSESNRIGIRREAHRLLKQGSILVKFNHVQAVDDDAFWKAVARGAAKVFLGSKKIDPKDAVAFEGNGGWGLEFLGGYSTLVDSAANA